MVQNIYDEPAFFEGYSQLPRSTGGLAEAVEWPTVRSFLPDLQNARILDLGCGFGAFDRWAVEQGADTVVAIDLSEKMLAQARERTATDKIRYVLGDLSALDGLAEDFDLVYSALAFHYIADFETLCGDMRQRLRVGGSLVATIEHPIFTAPTNPRWIEDGEHQPVWPLDSYFSEGKRVTNWIAEGVVKYHRTMSTYVRCLAASGFVVRNLAEWVPGEEHLRAHPEWANEVHRPMFLIIRADAI